MLSKLQLSIKKFFASITNTKPISPTNPEKNVDKIFIPTFESQSSILFWAFWTIFLAFYGLAVQADEIESIGYAILLFLQYLISNVLVMLFNIGFTFLSVKHLQNKSHKQIAKYILLNSLILTPIAVLLIHLIFSIFFDMPWVWSKIIVSLITTMLAVVVILALFLYYFSHYQKDRDKQYQHYQLALLEQNEQIKARITPHFFFNMLNTLQYLIEENPYEAENMLRSVSNLYRVSFNGSQEIGFLEEIEICKHYLSIEQHRFADRLSVTWQLPDEDMLYDMTISSLTLQLAIEKIIIFVVENTAQATKLDILVDWQNNMIDIQVIGSVQGEFSHIIHQQIAQKMRFNNQITLLQETYGSRANIDYKVNNNTLLIQIEYPLFDVSV